MWKFPLAAANLGTDWAWYLRAATLAGVKVTRTFSVIAPHVFSICVFFGEVDSVYLS